MAIYTETEIYKQAYEMLFVVTEHVANMPRNYKHFLGRQLCEDCQEIIVLISRANKALEKEPHLTTLLEVLGRLDVLFRLCVDRRFISKQQYAAAVLMSTSVGKQANGWRRNSMNSPVASRPRP